METQLKQLYVQEAKYQIKMMNRLKGWLKSLIIFSSISLILILFGSSIHSLLKIVGIITMVMSVIGCIVVGLGLKNGKDNVNKILDKIQ